MKRIKKFVVPLYDAENVFDDIQFEKEIKEKLKIDEQVEFCKTCGSRIFYVRTTFANNEGYPRLIDVELVCAECGDYFGGYSIEDAEKLADESDKSKKKGVERKNSSI